jgi:predicted AlkP superfamily pyrophosphatase or phosphodiesterase
VSWLVPEYWRAGSEDDRKLIRALSTPGLLEAVAASYPRFWERFSPPIITDEGATDIAHHLLTAHEPDLLMLHIFQVDSAQHAHGLWSPEALAAIEHADRQLGRLLAVLDAARPRADTLFMVVSDHGFMNVRRKVHPGALLREAGLVELDEAGKPRAFRAALLASGGQAYVYLNDPADSSSAARVRQLLSDKVAQPGSGLARIYDRRAIAEVGGDEDAFLALEAEPGVMLGDGYEAYETEPTSAAVHGYDPRRSELRASLLWMGPGVRPGLREAGRLVDVAPTISRWLGLAPGTFDGTALD